MAAAVGALVAAALEDAVRGVLLLLLEDLAELLRELRHAVVGLLVLDHLQQWQSWCYW